MPSCLAIFLITILSHVDFVLGFDFQRSRPRARTATSNQASFVKASLFVKLCFSPSSDGRNFKQSSTSNGSSPRRSSQQASSKKAKDQPQPKRQQQSRSKRRAPRVPPLEWQPALSSAQPLPTKTTATTSIASTSQSDSTSSTTLLSSRRNPSSLGEAIQLASTVSELFELCFQIPHPSNITASSSSTADRLRYQRWSAQLLQKLGNLWPINNNHENHVGTNGNNVWQDERLVRAVMVAAGNGEISLGDKQHNQREVTTMTSKTITELSEQARSVQWSLQGLSALAGKVTRPVGVDSGILQSIRRLIHQAEYLSSHDDYCCQLHQVVEMRWASMGLLMRLGGPHVLYPTVRETVTDRNNKNNNQWVTRQQLYSLLPNMQRRVQHLPFDIIPCGIQEWSSPSFARDDVMNQLQQEIPFAFDEILTRQGLLVTERRGTAWLTEPGIGPMAYSGKLMQPHSPLPPLIQSIMRTVESVVGIDSGFLNCALCNWYPHDQAAMKFHCDPDHGILWDRCAVVIAIGDPRRFAFRPNPNNINLSWRVWDKNMKNSLQKFSPKAEDLNTPAVVHLFSGDIVQMWDTCNEDFQHAVFQGNAQPNDDESGDGCQGRISIVMKHAIARIEGT